MNNSQAMTKRSMSIWQFTLLISAAYIIGLVISHQSTVMETVYWSGYELEEIDANGNWVESNRMRIGVDAGIQEVRFRVQVDDAPHWQRPIGLMLGGPFSAQVFWDEQMVLEKGTIGDSKATELAGSIDAITFIPPTLLHPGEHHIRLLISTQHLLLHDDSVFHYIWLTPYRESGRRDMRYYAAPLIILSALLILSLQSFRIGRNAGNQMHIGLGIYGFSIIVLLCSEVSRSLINYSYPYHELRGIFAWLSNISAGAALIYTCYQINKTRLSKGILLAGVAVLFSSYFFPMNSGDERLALDFTLLALAPAVVFLLALVRKHISYLITLPIFWLSCVASNLIDTGLFLDSYHFIASLILIAGAWLWVYVDFRVAAEEQPMPQGCREFQLTTPQGSRNIAVSECYALKGEGNYTSLLLLDGSSALHQDGLGIIMDSAPINFVRVHKSYAINTTAIVNLKSAPGSKYWAEMTNGENVPVSRYRVAELRSILAEDKS
ncbi:LytTR family DNA-binding domain-containing protein [Alteromonas sp. ASW11-36]|uniref:LytTR family DNA-binding domain-containing protein n=1 Tax=Alteromonas arenosi TaxID=3055817 RepID=A0ABT7SYK1_9ALTE|nr:LytTR family DNA-binding domain-containing protein [Alteromonas sp. ASW11-36]MDM7861262.1 LytTR family DNA-binding domain-containing protein [Alteromonas sp. ASW11-36]